MTKVKVESSSFHLLSQGLRLRVFMARPEGGTSLPAVLVNHGGGGMDALYEKMCVKLADRGYVATAMTFRGYQGSGGRQEYGKGEIEDVLALVAHLTSQDFVDGGRVGMFGYSRGALNTLLACERRSGFRVVVLWSVPVDMVAHHVLNPFIEDLIGGSPGELAQEYWIRSAINFVDGIDCPILIIHGEDDEVIPVKHAYMLASELERNNKDFQMKIYPGEGHAFTLKAFQDAWQETVGFLDRYLQR